jgi:hypothetical protein
MWSPTRIIATIGVAAAFTAPAAGALGRTPSPPAGEPKNEWPFTRAAHGHLTARVLAGQTTSTTFAGEPKNEWPFTRRLG